MANFPWQSGYVDPYQWTYTETSNPCPVCGQGLRLVDGSRMLVCSNKDTDPLFLV